MPKPPVDRSAAQAAISRCAASLEAQGPLGASVGYDGRPRDSSRRRILAIVRGLPSFEATSGASPASSRAVALPNRGAGAAVVVGARRRGLVRRSESATRGTRSGVRSTLSSTAVRLPGRATAPPRASAISPLTSRGELRPSAPAVEAGCCWPPTPSALQTPPAARSSMTARARPPRTGQMTRHLRRALSCIYCRPFTGSFTSRLPISGLWLRAGVGRA